MDHPQFPAAAVTRHRPYGLTLLLAGAAVALSACHRSEPVAAATASNGTAAAAAGPAALQAAASPATAAPASTAAAAQAAATTQAPAATPRELQLSLDSHPADAADAPEGLTAQRGQLPDLFAGDKPASKVAVAGGLLTDPAEKRLLESVNGAELSIEVKTR